MSVRPEVHLGQWSLAARSWSLHGSPLRPGEQDVDSYRQALTDWCDENPTSPPRALILGVTPEIYRLPWPKGASVTAVDRTPEMIEHVWPGPRSNALLSDWREVPLPERSVDLVFCDGGLHLLDFPDGQARLCGELERLITPGGRFTIRLFVPPAVWETSEEVLDDLMAGTIPSLNSLKLRLWMSLQETPTAGVSVRQVWERLHSAAPNWSELAAKLGWPLEHVSAIDAYRDSHARYHCVTGEQVEHLMCEGTGGAFELDRVSIPSYAMGAQCPTLVFRRTYKHRGAR